MEPIAIAATAADVAYVRASYVTLDQLARGLGEDNWPGIRLPRATYQLTDGSQWYPRDWWRLYDDAAGSNERDSRDAEHAGRVADRIQALFTRRLATASRALGHPCDPAAEWAAYLAGLYGACLREVTPEAIVHKEALVARLTRALADPRPEDLVWRDTLRNDVEALDGLTRPFATCDRERFGGTTSRARLIDGARQRFPAALAIP